MAQVASPGKQEKLKDGLSEMMVNEARTEGG